MARTARKTAAPVVAAPAKPARKARTAKPATTKAIVAPAVAPVPVDTRKGSVVKQTYKAKYAERGDATGCGDWLHTTLKDAFPSPLDVRAFEAMLDANGVRHSHWKKSNPGLLRMSGRMALASRIAEAGKLVVPGRKAIPVPAAFRDKHSS